jgi:CheY-like chemotaxis protein
VTASDDYVLVVEDDRNVRDVLVELLFHHGYASCTAANGDEALAFLRAAAPPCLILVDDQKAQKVPAMGGEELLEELGRMPALARVPICVLTADALYEAERVDAVLTKPIDEAALVGVIDRHCRAGLTWSSRLPTHRDPN